jgi:hypothetical protein
MKGTPFFRAISSTEVLAANVDQLAVDGARTGDHAVSRGLLAAHPEVFDAMGNEEIDLFEGSFIKQHFQALAGSEFALLVLGRNGLLTPSQYQAALPLL